MAEAPQSLLDRILHPGPRHNQKPLPPSGRAGRNLPAAVTTAVVLIALLAVTLVFFQPGFIALVVLLVLGAIWEMGGALARIGVHIPMAPLYVGGAGILITAWRTGEEGALVALAITIFVVVIWRLVEGQGDKAVRDCIAGAFTAIYVPFLASFAILILTRGGALAVAVFITVIVANDLGGWCAGILFGKHPMSPRISPKKSWEGFAGSVIFCMAAAVGGMHQLGGELWWGVIMGALGALGGTAGDLTESMIKREVGLKDMSGLLPGHGGILDRVDAILLTAPIMFLLLGAALAW